MCHIGENDVLLLHNFFRDEPKYLKIVGFLRVVLLDLIKDIMY